MNVSPYAANIADNQATSEEDNDDDTMSVARGSRLGGGTGTERASFNDPNAS